MSMSASQYDDMMGTKNGKKPSTKTFRLVIPGPPCAKPRMTQRDKWDNRKCVVKYRAWADLARVSVAEQLVEMPEAESILSLSWVAHIQIPKSWSKKDKAAAVGQLHRSKPDRDNIDKAVLDSLFKADQAIASGHIEKRWSNEPRLEVTIEVANV